MSSFSCILFLFILISTFTITLSKNWTEQESAIYSNFLIDQKRLFTDLFKDYDPSLCGVYTLYRSKFLNQTNRVHPPMMELKVIMQMLKLVDVVEVEEKVTFLFDYISRWEDPRLRWDPNKYGGITHIYIPRGKVWLPEVTIADAHEVKFFESVDAPSTAWINYDGSVGYYTSTVTSVICSLDVFRFPLDSHECGVNVLFHGYYANEYQIVNGGQQVPKALKDLGNGEWQVNWIGVAQEKAGANISDVIRFEAKFSRNPLFYITLVMIPAYLINFLSLIAIFLNLDNIPEKLNVGLTNIMAMTFILIILGTDLPKTKGIPLIAIYVMNGLLIMMIALAIIFAIPLIRKLEKRWKKRREAEKEIGEEKAGSSKFSRVPEILKRPLRTIKMEFVLMAIFQIANFLNFMIIFM